jgi:hypothetical protein
MDDPKKKVEADNTERARRRYETECQHDGRPRVDTQCKQYGHDPLLEALIREHAKRI